MYTLGRAPGAVHCRTKALAAAPRIRTRLLVSAVTAINGGIELQLSGRGLREGDSNVVRRLSARHHAAAGNYIRQEVHEGMGDTPPGRIRPRGRLQADEQSGPDSKRAGGVEGRDHRRLPSLIQAY